MGMRLLVAVIAAAVAATVMLSLAALILHVGTGAPFRPAIGVAVLAGMVVAALAVLVFDYPYGKQKFGDDNSLINILLLVKIYTVLLVPLPWKGRSFSVLYADLDSLTTLYATLYEAYWIATALVFYIFGFFFSLRYVVKKVNKRLGLVARDAVQAQRANGNDDKNDGGGGVTKCN